MTHPSDPRPLRKGQAWIRRGTDDVAVYNPDDGRLHVLNPSALAIWELCDGATAISEIAEAVAEATGIPLPRAKADVECAISQFQAVGLVVC